MGGLVGLFVVVLGWGFIFKDMVLWVFVSEDGIFGVFINESTGLGCKREGGLRRGWAHCTLGKSKGVPGRFCESQREKDLGEKAGEVYPERVNGRKQERCTKEKAGESGRKQERKSAGESRRGVPRENSWYIVPICFPCDSTGANRAGVYWSRVGMNVAADEKEHKDKNQR